jgi:hypothetical protein
MGGRPTDYDEEILSQSREYLNACEDEVKILTSTINDKQTVIQKLKVNLPTIEGLARYLKIHRDTLYEWKKIHKEFSDIIEELQQKQAERLLSNGLSGDYNPTIAKVLLTKHGYTDRQEIDQKTQHSGEVHHTIDYSKLSDAALREIEAQDKPEGSKD